MSSPKSRSKKRAKSSPKPAPRPQNVAATPASLDAPARSLKTPRVEPAFVEAPRSEAPVSQAPNTFWMAALGIMVVAILFRQYDLGLSPSFHSDENIHAWYAQGFKDYAYNPTFHGPLLYHLVAASFALFGQYDYTARLVPSLLGIGLIALIVGPCRRWLGERGALWAAGMLAISPSLVTYSRILFHDALVLDLTLGAVLCFVTALHHPPSDKRGHAALYGLFACLSLFLATKANFFFVLVVILAFWAAWWLRGRVSLRQPLLSSSWWPLGLFALVTFTAIAFPGTPPYKTPSTDPQHRAFQIACVLGCAMLLVWTLTRPMDADEDAGRAKWKAGNDWATWVLALALAVWLYVLLFGQAAQIIGQWATSHHFPSEAFAKGRASAQSAIPQMLDYWGGQQKEPRLPGRHDYYVTLGLLYEAPLLFVTLGGILHAARHRSVWSDFLLWWAFASWAVYALANEKVPWLLVHILLPFALLSGTWLASLDWRFEVRRLPQFARWSAAALGALFLLRGDWAMIVQRAGDNDEPLLYAQTPDAFRRAIEGALERSRGDARQVWIQTNGRQWPSWWHLRTQNNPLMANSTVAMGATIPDPTLYRAFVANESDLANWKNRDGWHLDKADFFIWTRPSWTALDPSRFWNWYWSRQSLRPDERDTVPGGAPMPKSSATSILAGEGEWSYQNTIVGSREKG